MHRVNPQQTQTAPAAQPTATGGVDPIIRLVNSLLFQAVKERATDIHITPDERDISVRFRVKPVTL